MLELVKPSMKNFSIQQGKEKKNLQYGLIRYFEARLRKLYENANETGVNNYSELKLIKAEIDSHRQKLAAGVKVRSRIQDTLANETISKFLIAKQKEIAQKKIIHTMLDDNGTNLITFTEIQNHVTDFYKILYCRKECNEEIQEYFLSFLNNELSESDRELLNAPISKSEIYGIIKSMDENKTPGNDGFPIEFYDEN